MDLEQEVQEAGNVLTKLKSQGFNGLSFTGVCGSMNSYIFKHTNGTRVVGNSNGFERAYLCSDKPGTQMKVTVDIEEAKKLLYSDVARG